MAARRPARLLAALAAVVALAAPADAGRDRDEGTARLATDGELVIGSHAGQFERHAIDPATGLVVLRDDLSSYQETRLHLDTALTRNVNERWILDLDDRFLGSFASPQEPQTGRVSELDNRLRMRLGLAHDDRTASEFGLSADHARTTLDLLAEEDLNLYDAHWMIDRALGRRTFLTFKTGRESGDYVKNPAEDYHRIHHRLKLSRYVDAVGRQPAAFKHYLLEDMPESLREEERYMDLAWDLFLGFDQYDLRNAPSADDHDDVILGAGFNLAISEFASLEAGISSALRSHESETVATRRLNFGRNRLHLELDHWLTSLLRLSLATDLVTTNYLNAAGFDENDFWHALSLEYSHRPYIQWDVTVSGNTLSYEAATAGFPDTRDFRLRSEWTRWYGGRTAFTWTEEVMRYRVPAFASEAFSPNRRIRTLFTWTRLLLDDVTLELGLGKDDEIHDTYKENDATDEFLRSAVRIAF